MGATTGLAHVALPAACGELVQGTLDGVRCLVSCPIDRYSIAKVTLQPEPGWVQRQVDVRVANYPLVAGGPRYNVDETTERLIAG